MLLAEVTVEVALRGPSAYATVPPETAALLHAAGIGLATQLTPTALGSEAAEAVSVAISSLQTMLLLL